MVNKLYFQFKMVKYNKNNKKNKLNKNKNHLPIN